MNQNKYDNILSAIISDNVADFSAAFKENKSICFGRFPLLSVCYLYRAKKIIKIYEKQLLEIDDYEKVFEPYEIYDKFKAVAGRSLRLYISGKIVSPLEMLAILHKDRKVKKLYREYLKEGSLKEKTIKNLKAIYTISKQKHDINRSNIRIASRPLSRKQKLIINISAVIIILLSSAIYSAINLVDLYVGFGTASSPHKIRGVKQLEEAMAKDKHYILLNDLTLNNELSISINKSTIDFNNMTITIDYLSTSSIFKTNEGALYNLNVAFNNLEGNINSALGMFVGENKGEIKNISLLCDKVNIESTKSFSLFAGSNSGLMENVKVECKDIDISCTKNAEDIYVVGLATNNSGTITNCKVKMDCDIKTYGEGECYVAAVGNNDKDIKGIELCDGSNIKTNEADVAGICVNNSGSGTISDCKNHADILQDSSIDEWSPNVGGIVLTNYGSVGGCINYGDLKVVSTNELEDSDRLAFLGGIAAVNHSKIEKCLSKGNLTVSTKQLLIYCGGISAYSASTYNESKSFNAEILDCGAVGTLNISTEDENVFAFGEIGRAHV